VELWQRMSLRNDVLCLMYDESADLAEDYKKGDVG